MAFEHEVQERSGAPRRAIARNLVASAAALGAVYGCSCDSLYGFDTPKPLLRSRDQFEADPSCPDLVVDTSLVTTPQSIITLTGRRYDTGLGAESVPVVVTIGECGAEEDAGSPADGGQDAASPDVVAREASAGQPASTSNPSCSGSLRRLDRLHEAAFELVVMEEQGCRRRSPTRLECRLNASGEASFAIQGRSLDDGLHLSGYVPICVTPRERDMESPKHQTLIHVIPRFGRSRVAIAVVNLPDDKGALPLESDNCESLHNCDTLHPRARFLAGVISKDIPPGDARESDFLPLSGSITLTARVSTLSALPSGTAAPFLSTDSACPTPDAGVPDAPEADGGAPHGLPLPIGGGQRETDVFYLCAPAYEASYRITPRLLEETAEPPDIHPSEVKLSAVVEGYVAEPEDVGHSLYVKPCGAGEELAPHSAVKKIEKPLSVQEQRVVIGACATASSSDDAGTGTVGDAGNDAGEDSACQTIRLELESGGTCELRLQ